MNRILFAYASTSAGPSPGVLGRAGRWNRPRETDSAQAGPGDSDGG